MLIQAPWFLIRSIVTVKSPKASMLIRKYPTSFARVEQKKNVSAAKLRLTSSQVERLKKKANDQLSKEGVRPYSRFEAIAAHIWRCASKARQQIGENQLTAVRSAVNIRNRLIPPLPQNYFGNALAKTVTSKCYVGDIISNPLCYVAQKIREAVNVVTNEYIRSQLNDVNLGREQLDYIRAFFLGQGPRMSVPYSGNHIISVVSWMTMSVYEADFGWGKPMHFGFGLVTKQNMVRLIQSPDGDGVIVFLNFETAQLQLIKKFFYEDCSEDRNSKM
ncbi:Spermidine hydroxycinnamoyl transferase [Spatholobus suberectus]|nr:Spermidine hydroxycinnamoyl transferase [Spatholobus suberectus]